MLVLFETPAGYALFKVVDKAKLKSADLYQHFNSAESANEVVKLAHFSKFEDTTQALSAITALNDGKLDKGLKKFLKAHLEDISKLAVGDVKLGNLIKEKLDIKCVHDETINELFRGIRQQMSSLIPGLTENDRKAMRLGLSHSLCRYKLKFSPDKVDTMIVQAIALLDELDKELNTYAMRVREWYGWHFPEMGKIVTDNIQYSKVVRKMEIRTKAVSTDLSDILSQELETELKAAAEVSMGTEISVEDVENITELCSQVVEISEYRASLYEYLKNRMHAIAPNLSIMVGELVGARLIAHAGSLLSLAKHPASTIQILGAEKALFRALKTKHETPKYGLIYHASLVGQATPKFKGRISRVLAAKTALSIRMDALGEVDGPTIGIAAREKVEARLRELEGGKVHQISGTGKSKSREEKYSKPDTPSKMYNPAADVALFSSSSSSSSSAVKNEADEEAERKRKKAEKKEKKRLEAAAAASTAAPVEPQDEPMAAVEDAEEKSKEKKKKKKHAKEVNGSEAVAVVDDVKSSSSAVTPKKDKKRKIDDTVDSSPPAAAAEPTTPATEKKKKKKKGAEESTDDK